jgi:hypothetical protein
VKTECRLQRPTALCVRCPAQLHPKSHVQIAAATRRQKPASRATPPDQEQRRVRASIGTRAPDWLRTHPAFVLRACTIRTTKKSRTQPYTCPVQSKRVIVKDNNARRDILLRHSVDNDRMRAARHRPTSSTSRRRRALHQATRRRAARFTSAKLGTQACAQTQDVAV